METLNGGVFMNKERSESSARRLGCLHGFNAKQEKPRHVKNPHDSFPGGTRGITHHVRHAIRRGRVARESLELKDLSECPPPPIAPGPRVHVARRYRRRKSCYRWRQGQIFVDYILPGARHDRGGREVRLLVA